MSIYINIYFFLITFKEIQFLMGSSSFRIYDSFCLIFLKKVELDFPLIIFFYFNVSRRFVWNFFRLENEHLNNCGKFRAVRDISVAPMDSSDQGHIIRMMDMEDGVTNRHRKKPKKKDTRLLLDPEESTDDPDAS